MQMNDETLMSIVERSREMKVSQSEDSNENLVSELAFFFDNVMDTVVEYFEIEKV